jgi:hypothetical protein
MHGVLPRFNHVTYYSHLVPLRPESRTVPQDIEVRYAFTEGMLNLTLYVLKYVF